MKFISLLFFLTLIISTSFAAETPSQTPSPKPTLTNAVISPDGKYLVVMVKDDKFKFNLQVMCICDFKMSANLTTDGAGFIGTPTWINDKRLIFTANFDGERASSLFAVDRDGSDLRELISGNSSFKHSANGTYVTEKTLTADYVYKRVAHDGSDDVIVMKISKNVAGNETGTRLYRLNSRTGKLSGITENIPIHHITNWILDTNDQPRFFYANNDDVCQIYRWKNDDEEWAPFQTSDCKGDGVADPYFIDGENNLLVQHLYKNRKSLFKFDFDRNSIDGEPFFYDPNSDFSGIVKYDYGIKKIIGIYYDGTTKVKWLDEKMNQTQASVDRVLNQSVNVISCGNFCTSSENLLIFAKRPDYRTDFYILEVATSRLRKIN